MIHARSLLTRRRANSYSRKCVGAARFGLSVAEAFFAPSRTSRRAAIDAGGTLYVTSQMLLGLSAPWRLFVGECQRGVRIAGVSPALRNYEVPILRV